MVTSAISSGISSATGGGSSSSSSGQITKATITNVDEDPSGNNPITLMFNPTQYQISKGVDWSAKKTKSNVPPLEFGSGQSTKLSLSDLLFDTYELKQDVRDYTDKILDLANINSSKGRPPICRFMWGDGFSFDAVVDNVDITYSLFLPDGTPVRATVSIGMTECKDPDAQGGQNPTTQGTMGQKVYSVEPGDTIDWIAFKEYGDSSMWRAIADANNLDDPKNLRPGQLLAIELLDS